eukprot:5038117-Pleurochrysis_carterae.AAC.2
MAAAGFALPASTIDWKSALLIKPLAARCYLGSSKWNDQCVLVNIKYLNINLPAAEVDARLNHMLENTLRVP